MKKVLVIGSLLLTLGAVSFSRGGGGNGHGGGCGNGGYHHDMMISNPAVQNSQIIIDEKRLEVRKELLKTTPDWKKIEKLNTEIGTEQGKIRTLMEKYWKENPDIKNYK